MYNNSDNNNNNDNENKQGSNFKVDKQNIVGGMWKNRTKNGGDYFKIRVKAMDANGEVIKDENGNDIEHNFSAFYNKFNSKITDPTFLIYKPDREKYKGKDYDKYKRKIRKENDIKRNALFKETKIEAEKKKKTEIKSKIKKDTEDKVKKLDI